LFEHLVKQGYVVGLPPNKDHFMLWLNAVRKAVLATHKAGVVHLDLHPGNVV
jgi:Ser/Thr protein kinase RdoA (MazF antagonist)